MRIRRESRLRLLVFLALAVLTPALLPAADMPPEAKKESKEEKKPPLIPEEKASRTQHSITLDGQRIAYTATAGNYLMKEEDGTPKASIFYVAYTRDGVKDPAERPITFSFNGGPGAAAVWVQFGAFGPKIVERTDEGMALPPPPGRLVDNEFSLLDVTDLVFIDPVSTGYSRTVPGVDAKQYHGIKPDIASVGEFIRLWITRNERWASPKFLAGESYGTTRSAGLAEYLQSRYGMDLNGIVLISSVLNWQAILVGRGNDMPYYLFLPTYAATAWYHRKLPPELAGDLEKTLREVEDFALHEYAPALLEGDQLPAARQKELAAKIARYSGLSPDFVLRASLRVGPARFEKELLRDRGQTVGRLDSRFLGSDLDSIGEFPEYDPADVSLDAPYAAAVNDYLRRELGFKDDHVYERQADLEQWSAEGFEMRYPYLGEALREAMVKNPDLQVLVASGRFDLATPYFDAAYTAHHLGLPEALRGHMRTTTFDAGHMMYIRQADHRKLKQEIAEFMRAAARKR